MSQALGFDGKSTFANRNIYNQRTRKPIREGYLGQCALLFREEEMDFCPAILFFPQ